MASEEIQSRIREEIRKTEEAVQEYKDLAKPEAPDVAIGRVSRMDAINNRSVLEAALRKAEEKLKNLRNVEAKMEEPDFGICVKCKNEIPIARVMIRPESLLCVRCAH